MNWRLITVPRGDLALAIGAIRGAGGTVTASNPAGSMVALTYVTTKPDDGVRSTEATDSAAQHEPLAS